LHAATTVIPFAEQATADHELLGAPVFIQIWPLAVSNVATAKTQIANLTVMEVLTKGFVTHRSKFVNCAF
jgi:hypothetical protein